jgi:hypothetical protein
MPSRHLTQVLLVIAAALLLVAPTCAHDVVRRQAAPTTTNETDIIFTIQTDTVLESTSSSSVRFSNSTFTAPNSAAPSSATASTTEGSGSGNDGQATSVAYSTYTIPLSNGGVTTSTEFAAPSTASQPLTVQDGGAHMAFGNVKNTGILWAIAIMIMNVL